MESTALGDERMVAEAKNKTSLGICNLAEYRDHECDIH